MKKNVLLIEDNQGMRENAAEILELANYHVYTAPNGKEGVRLAQHYMPDLIICDIMMPELDGYGVLHMLSKDEKTAHIPFIFLSAKAEKSDVRKGMSLGADDYLTKPFDDTELLNAVETRLRKTEIARKTFANSDDGFNSFLNEAATTANLNDLTKNKKSKSFEKRELIYAEGSIPQGLYYLSSGKVKLYKTNEVGKEFIVELKKEGDFFGYSDLLEDKNHSEAAETLEASQLTFIPKEDFNKLVYKNKDVAAQLFKLLSENVAVKEKQLLSLAYNSVRKRVAQSLTYLYETYSKSTEENFSMAISREDLASLVGTATETVIRTLSDFKEEKLITIKGSQITILKPDVLKRMKN